MLAAYYDRSESTEELFKNLSISKDDSYKENLNQYDVIKINMQEFLLVCSLMSFGYFIVIVTDEMIKDKNAVIRFIGYMIDVIMAILVFYLILYYYFDIKLLEIFL